MSKKLKQSAVFLPAKAREWHKNAVVGWHTDPDQTYAAGYHEAAEIVASCALEGHYQDRLFYPICYLYRHALEITLKDLVRHVEHLIRLRACCEKNLAKHVRSTHEVDAELESTHSLEILLNLLEARLRIAVPNADIPSRFVVPCSSFTIETRTARPFGMREPAEPASPPSTSKRPSTLNGSCTD